MSIETNLDILILRLFMLKKVHGKRPKRSSLIICIVRTINRLNIPKH